MAGTIVTFEIILLDEIEAVPESICEIIDYWSRLKCEGFTCFNEAFEQFFLSIEL